MSREKIDAIAWDLFQGMGTIALDLREAVQRQAARDILDAALEAAGYAIVPVQPTNAMVEVGTEARWQSAIRDANNVREIYRAMIAAAKE